MPAWTLRRDIHNCIHWSEKDGAFTWCQLGRVQAPVAEMSRVPQIFRDLAPKFPTCLWCLTHRSTRK